MHSRSVVRAVAVVACMVFASSACASKISGSPVAIAEDTSTGQSDGDPAADPDQYEFPENGGGFPKAAPDQLAPVPGYNWKGWDKQPSGRCAWVTPGMFDGVASAPPFPAGHFCSFLTIEGSNIQISWGGAFNPFLYDAVAYMEPAEVAGLQARAYNLAANQQVYPGSCQVQVHTRSLSGLQVLHWNEHKQPLDQAVSCAKAKQVAEIIAKKMVPAAGGTVWASTPQQPNPALVGKKACVVVDDIVTTFAGIAVKDKDHKEGSNDIGATCVADRGERHSVALLTEGPDQGLAHVDPAKGAKVTDIPIGPLKARKEIHGRTCAVAVEFVPGRLLRIQYSNDKYAEGTCMYARLMVMVALGRMVEKGS